MLRKIRAVQEGMLIWAMQRLNMEQNHGIEYCFFRTAGKREFIETAFCPECNSNNVVFDITHDALIKALRKINKDLFM